MNAKHCQMWVGYYYVGTISTISWYLHKWSCPVCRDMERAINAETDWIGSMYDQNV